MATAKKKSPSNRSQQADAARKTKEALHFAMADLVEAARHAQTFDPYTYFAPEVKKRIAADKKFVYENRLAWSDPSTVKVKKAKPKK